MIPSRVPARRRPVTFWLAATLLLGAAVGGGCQASGIEEPVPTNTQPPTTSIDDAVDSLPEFPYTMDEWLDLAREGAAEFEPGFLEGLSPEVGLAWGLRYGFQIEVRRSSDRVFLEIPHNRLKLYLGEDGLVRFAGIG